MQSPIWVLPGPFPHRGNAHPVTCDRRKFCKVMIWVLVVVIGNLSCAIPYSRSVWRCTPWNTKLCPTNTKSTKIGLR